MDAAIDHAAHLLPAQGPISVFIHHNTLHAFEDRPFERAVVDAQALLGCEPFLPAARYRAALRRGRIRAEDLRAVLAADLGARAAEDVGSLGTRLEVRLGLLRFGLPPVLGAELDWLLAETDALEALRAEVHSEARERFLARGRTHFGRDLPLVELEQRSVGALWAACLAAVDRCPEPDATERPAPLRHRDLLLETASVDSDLLVHPPLVRLCAAFLDQGISYWPMPERERGFRGSVLELYGRRPPSIPDPWLRRLAGVLAEDRARHRSDRASLRASLVELGVDEAEAPAFLAATALALRGWAGMFRQVEERPDRVPVHAPPASLEGFLAVRLLLERAALAHLAERELGYRGPLASLRGQLRAGRPRELAVPTTRERAWPLFQLAQLLGREATEIAQLTAAEIEALLAEIDAFPELERRRLLHLAFEHRFRQEVLDTLVLHARDEPAPSPAPARIQAIFCIDEREESVRRHLEETAPAIETLGAAGFFGIPMYYRGLRDAHARPLCPVVVRPEHEVAELALDAAGELERPERRVSLTLGRLAHAGSVGSRTFVRGTLISALLGTLAAVPLVLRVLLPRLSSRLGARGRTLLSTGHHTRLAVERRLEEPSLGTWSGFTTDEMAAIVRRLLEDLGLVRRLGELVLVVGHGSSSLNNPHESAHDCGACGGGHGGPNARAFAQMANDPDVRAALAASGLELPAGTWFLGAEHNSCDDSISYLDVDLVPAPLRPLLEEAQEALDRARALNAHERCRRFEGLPARLSARAALAHVEARSVDLAQPRPEYGHATNAVCFVGHRSRTRGLFLDRRAFLVSYDPTTDDDAGTVLGRLLGAVVPVVAGISLEYYFGYVDPVGYGCGTKLPHNVTGLLGVMDGHASDLRTGLPWQMLEIHEPVRLLLVVESTRERLDALLERSPAVARLVRNRWLNLAVLEPETGEVWELAGAGFVRHVPDARALPVAPSSADWYAGRRDHLPFARIVAGSPARRPGGAPPSGSGDDARAVEAR